MLKLGAPEGGWLGSIASEDPADPRPYLLAGVRVRFAPIGIKAVRAARRAVAAALRIDVDDIEEAGDALSRELIRRGILAWEGIGDAAGVPLTPGQLVPAFDDDGEPRLGEDGEPMLEPAVELLMRDPTAFETADRVYVRPWSNRELEKNGFAGSPNGISVTPATGTATGSATKPRTADALPTRKAKPRKRERAVRT